MKIVETSLQLQELLASERAKGNTIGLVPTMGALHQGHISLVEQAKKDCDICIVTIFVNPNQFNNKEDLEKYPRTLGRDAILLTDVGADIVFAPTVQEVYPEPDTRVFDFGQLEKVMEGKHRPGHFNGVAQVVSRFFYMVEPDKAYFGEKDFQQLAIIREMVKQLNFQVEIVPMPIIREASGLALSSRNERLTLEERKVASNIFKILEHSRKSWCGKDSVARTELEVIAAINAFDELTVEYFEIVDGYTLQKIEQWDDAKYIVGCIAVFCNQVRLIDNIVYKK